jgi:hypothetical protein
MEIHPLLFPTYPKPPEPKLTDTKWIALYRAAIALGIEPEALIAVIAFETGYTFAKLQTNPNSKGIGLLQFMPETLKELRITNKQIVVNSFEWQVNRCVVRYIEKRQNTYKIRNVADLYMTVLWPVATEKALDYILFRSPSKVYKANSGLDKEAKGFVTKKDAARTVVNLYIKYKKAGLEQLKK